MVVSSSRCCWLIVVTLFLACASYFSITAYYLPDGAGPDYPLSQAAVTFYRDHQRLAVYPQDVDLIEFSKFGNTRALRPPLSFSVSAVLAEMSPWLETDWRFAYRHGSALFCSLAVILVFLTVRLYTQRTWIGVSAALLLALMPQFTFTASYLNDDSAAFFAVAYLIYAMVRIVKLGKSNVNLMHFGLALGLMIISKMTAWLVFPAALVFYFAYLFRFRTQTLFDALIIGVFLIISGGWWCVWNMWHYGLLDPFALGLTYTLIDNHASVNLSQLGFAAQGVGFYSLLLYNHLDFWGATYKAVIGHIDWLIIRMSSVQYGFYLLVPMAALAYFLWSSCTVALQFFKNKRLAHVFAKPTREWTPNFLFEVILVFMFAFQMLVYTWHNIHNDIQIQGKYLLPIVPAVLLLMASFLCRFANLESVQRLLALDKSKIWVQLAIAAFMISIVAVHFHAVTRVVMPHYWPNGL